MPFGIGRELKRAGRKAEKTTKKAAKQIVAPTQAIKRGGEEAVVAGKEIGLLPPDKDIPEPEAAAVMPIPDEELQRTSRRRARAKRRGGRSSSILSESSLG